MGLWLTQKNCVHVTESKNLNIITVKIKIGNVTIEQEHQAKLFGMTINNKQWWSHQIRESGGFIPTLNKRLHVIRKLKKLSKCQGLKKVAKSLYISKLRYGTQHLGKNRSTNENPKSVDLKVMQVNYNRLARLVVSNVWLKSRLESSSLLKKWVGFHSIKWMTK
jgi:hypothetical protein